MNKHITLLAFAFVAPAHASLWDFSFTTQATFAGSTGSETAVYRYDTDSILGNEQSAHGTVLSVTYSGLVSGIGSFAGLSASWPTGEPTFTLGGTHGVGNGNLLNPAFFRSPFATDFTVFTPLVAWSPISGGGEGDWRWVSAEFNNGYQYFSSRPVSLPEPPTWLLLALGITTLGFSYRNAVNKQH